MVPSGACATAKSFNYAERDTEADWRHLGRLSFLHITFSLTFPTLPFLSPPRARRLSLYSPASPSFYTKNEALLPFCFEKSRQRRNRKHIQHSQTCAAGKAVDLIDPARPGRAARGPRVDASAHLYVSMACLMPDPSHVSTGLPVGDWRGSPRGRAKSR